MARWLPFKAFVPAASVPVRQVLRTVKGSRWTNLAKRIPM